MPKPSFDELDSQVLRPENPIVAAIMAAFRKLFSSGVKLAAGTAIAGKVGIDQTTPGTTNGVQVNAALPAGTNAIGSTKDGGPAWATSRGISGARFTSADQSGGFAAVTDAPTSGQKLCITDLLISSDASLRLDFAIEDDTGTIIETVYIAANETKQITPRGSWKLATANKKLMVQASGAGNISITPFYYSEA